MLTSPLKISKQHLRINKLIWACFGFPSFPWPAPNLFTQYSPSLESNHYIFPAIRVSAFCHPLLFRFFFFFFIFKSSQPENLAGFELYPGSDLFLPTSLLPSPLPQPQVQSTVTSCLDGCSSPLIGLPAFPLAFSARCCMVYAAQSWCFT